MDRCTWMRRPTLAARSEAGAGLDGKLDGTGYVGCEVGKDCFDMGKIKPAGNVLGSIVEDHGHVDRQRRAELTDRETSMTTANDLAVRRVLEEAGVEFIEENGGGPGVRLRKS
jgi:hypothetical protein